MKKIKQLQTSLIKFWAQPLANFLVERLKESKDSKDFENFYLMALYLDLYCTSKNIYLD